MGFVLAASSAIFLSGCSQGVSEDQSFPPPQPSEELVTPVTDVPSPTAPGEREDFSKDQVGQGDADVVFVRAVLDGNGAWTFHVTVSHPDTGWEDYTDGWDVVTDGGELLKADPESAFTRLMLHPHENEQPFTRSQSGIMIPAGVTIVTVRAHDIVDGFGGREVTVDLSVDEGQDFVVERE